MKKTNARRIVFNALLIAIYFVLGTWATLKLANLKITFEALPILIGALLFGPADGLLIGLLGSFLSQLAGGYGLTVTTPLWILPHALSGLVVGLYGVRRRDRELRFRELLLITAVSALLVTGLNTLALYVDAKIFHYYSKALVFGSLAVRIVTGIATAAAFSAVLPPILRALRRVLKK